MVETRHYTILLTDIKGFTDKTSRKTRADIMTMLDDHNKIVLPVLQAKGGKLIKTIGDAFLMVYESPTDAVLAGVAVQEALREHNKDKTGDERIDVRIAINSGEVSLTDNDVYGEAVNITARIEGIAEAGEVFFTESVYLAMNKNEVPSSEVGLLQLKGIPEKIRVYKVRREHPVEGIAQGEKPPRRLWDRLRPAGAPAAPLASSAKARYTDGPRPPVWRRAAALAIDGLLCAIVAGALFGRGERAGVRYDIPRKGKAAPVMMKDKGSKVRMDSSGIRVNDKDVTVSIGEDGISVKDREDGDETFYSGGGWSAAKKRARTNWHFALVWFVYTLVFLKKMGATPGKRILKLAVASMDGAPLDKKQALWRAAFSLVSGYALFLGYFWALFEKDRRGWHDLIAGTVVVNAESA